MSAVVSTSVRGSAAAGPGTGGELLQDLASWLAAGWGPPPASRQTIRQADRQSRPASAAEARSAAST